MQVKKNLMETKHSESTDSEKKSVEGTQKLEGESSSEQNVQN